MTTKTTLLPLEKREDGPGHTVPDEWPAEADLRWVSEQTRAAVDAVCQLSILLGRKLRSYPSDEATGPMLTAAEYGAMVLTLDALKQDAATILRDTEDLAKELDDVKWEAVQLGDFVA